MLLMPETLASSHVDRVHGPDAAALHTEVRRVLQHSQIILCEWRCPFCGSYNHSSECDCGARIGPFFATRAPLALGNE